jgi:hypothetical protein
LRSVVKTATRVSGSDTGMPRRKSALTMLNIVVLAPMPSASESAASPLTRGRFSSIRTAKRTSRKRSSMEFLPTPGTGG